MDKIDKIDKLDEIEKLDKMDKIGQNRTKLKKSTKLKYWTKSKIWTKLDKFEKLKKWTMVKLDLQYRMNCFGKISTKSMYPKRGKRDVSTILKSDVQDRDQRVARVSTTQFTKYSL